MAGNFGGIQPIGTFQYNPCSMYGNCDYLDLNYTPYMSGMDLGMGFNTDSSIFGGCSPFIGGAPMMGMGSNQSYFDNMKNYQKFYNDYNIDQQKMQRNADLQLNGSMEAIQEAAENLKDKVSRNEQDQIQTAYNAYIEAVRSAYGDGTEEEIKSRALSLYTRLNGESLIQQLRKNSHSSFLQGLLQPFTLGTYYKNSAEDNIAQITGQPVATGEKTGQNIGRIFGTAGVGVLAGGLTKALTKSNKLAGVVAIVGALLSGTLSTITGKISS
ncbi:hypothetical protein J6G99_06220 [bacterium]|nr:hypothetical protein [bacterium]